MTSLARCFPMSTGLVLVACPQTGKLPLMITVNIHMQNSVVKTSLLTDLTNFQELHLHFESMLRKRSSVNGARDKLKNSHVYMRGQDAQAVRTSHSEQTVYSLHKMLLLK